MRDLHDKLTTASCAAKACAARTAPTGGAELSAATASSTEESRSGPDEEPPQKRGRNQIEATADPDLDAVFLSATNMTEFMSEVQRLFAAKVENIDLLQHENRMLREQLEAFSEHGSAFDTLQYFSQK